MPTEDDLRTAERIKEKILETAGDSVERILFFGSRVTGRPRPYSDYDILVVLRDPVPDWAAVSLHLSDLFNSFERPVDVQVFGETEFEESRPVAGTVAYPADRHGVLLYAKPGRSSRSAGLAVGLSPRETTSPGQRWVRPRRKCAGSPRSGFTRSRQLKSC